MLVPFSVLVIPEYYAFEGTHSTTPGRRVIHLQPHETLGAAKAVIPSDYVAVIKFDELVNVRGMSMNCGRL
jgi:hypothetical protein